MRVLLPVGIRWLLGRPNLVLPMLAGAFCAMLLDGFTGCSIPASSR